jgi:hypothetical protein
MDRIWSALALACGGRKVVTLMTWRKLEAEIISILRENNFTIIADSNSGDMMIQLDFEFPTTFSLTTFAKELTQRLEGGS